MIKKEEIQYHYSSIYIYNILYSMVEQISIDYLKSDDNDDEEEDDDSDLFESKYILIEDSGALLGYHNAISYLNEFVHKKKYKYINYLF